MIDCPAGGDRPGWRPATRRPTGRAGPGPTANRPAELDRATANRPAEQDRATANRPAELDRATADRPRASRAGPPRIAVDLPGAAATFWSARTANSAGSLAESLNGSLPWS